MMKRLSIYIVINLNSLVSIINVKNLLILPLLQKKTQSSDTVEESLTINIPLELKRTYQHVAIDHNCTLKCLVIKALEGYEKSL